MPDRLAPANPITLSDRFAEDDPDRSRDLTDHQIRILDAAAEEFMHAGFDATSVDSIARRLGQTKGFIYYHFRSKLDIFHAVYERGMLMVRESVAPHFEADAPGVGGAGEGAARLAAMAEAHLANLLERTAYHDAMRQGLERLRGLKPTDPRLRTVLRLNALRDEYEGLFSQVITAGITDGSIREVPVSIATRTLLGGLNAVAAWHRTETTTPTAVAPPELAAAVVDILIRGVTQPPPRRRSDSSPPL